ncbi:MAG: TerD family protein [Prevotellaceae bacterium]|jgi:tellurium resistance protein TerD|nr:TerD family protein [Prevotellaceae bacterium]
MAIDIRKGQRVGLGLSKVGIGLGWDPNEGSGFDFDLDASAFMLGANKKLPKDEYFIFYNNLCGRGHSGDECQKNRCTDGLFGLRHTGDDPDGKSSDGNDDEALLADLSKVPAEVTEIIFCVTIHDYEIRKQNFGQVRNSYIRVYNIQTGEEIMKYELDEDFSVETAVEFGRLYKRNGEWRFEAMGVGYKGGLQYFVDKYA